MDGICGQMELSQCKYFLPSDGLTDTHIRSLRQKRTDHGLLFGDYLWNRTLCDHIAASGTGFRSHLDQPVRFGQNLGIMVYQNNGVAVSDQVMHHRIQPHNIRRMQTDGRLIQHIEHSCGTVPHCTCQLHPLSLPGGQRGCRTIQRQVSKSQIHQPFGHSLEGFANRFRHRPHLFGQRIRHSRYPVHQFFQGHLTGLRKPYAPKSRCSGRIRKSATTAFRTDVLL